MRSMSDRLAAAAPPPPPSPPGVVVPAPPVKDLDRILALPRRAPLDCSIDPVTRRYKPEAQALVEVITAQFSRGSRASCACRPRVLVRCDEGVGIYRVLPDGKETEPTVVSLEAFVADCQGSAAEVELARRVSALEVGEVLDAPAADGSTHGHPCIAELNAVQAWTLREAEQVGGVVAFAGVGSGKTITWLLAPLLFSDCRVAVLFISSKQRHHYLSHYLRLREHFRVPSVVFDFGGGRHDAVVPGAPPLHVYGYSTLSSKKQSQILDTLRPDVVGLDEGHRACGDSAINRRIKRYGHARIKEREAQLARGEAARPRAINVLVGSGTMENKSVEDTQMVCAFALGTGSPIPLTPVEAAAWGAVMDTCRRPDRKSGTARALHQAFAGRSLGESQLDELMAPSTIEKEVRQGFCDRRLHTRGIISAVASDVQVSMYLTERDVRGKVPEVVRQALRGVRDEWLRPDGDELVEKIEQVACARHVGCGFYNYWAFPKHPCGCPPDRTPARSSNWCAECRLIDDWYARRKSYKKEERSRVRYGVVDLDSPKLCDEAAERYWREAPFGDLPRWAEWSRQLAEGVDPGPRWESAHWREWKEIERRVAHEERVKWLDDFLARDAAEWALSTKGVVWFQSVPLGRKIAELSGLPYFNGGPGGEERLRAERGDRSVICSIKAHAEGTDGLQEVFHEQYVVEPPASNGGTQGWEQLLGRLPRRGQRKDFVQTWVNLWADELNDALDQALLEAEAAFERTRNPQRLLMCDKQMVRR